KNQKAVLTETGKGTSEMTLVGVDWQAAAVEDKKPEEEKFAGKWKFVSIAEGGEALSGAGGELAFAKDKVTIKNETLIPVMTYTLDAAKSPKWIDFTAD